MKRIDIRHTTRYGFGAPVRLGSHILLLRPREGHDLRIASSVLQIVPQGIVTWRRDLYDNVLAVVEFSSEPCEELVITSRVEVELYDTMPLDFVVDEHALHFPFQYQAEERIALAPYLEPVYSDDPRLNDWLSFIVGLPAETETFSILDHMNHRIQSDFGYELREAEGVRDPGEILRLGSGSCRDMAAFLVEACRRIGIAARFVSGYIHGPATEAGGAASHAWAEIYLPGAGWKGFDPTSAAVVGPDHIPVAVHRHPEAVPPVAGTFSAAPGIVSELSVDVQITQLPEK